MRIDALDRTLLDRTEAGERSLLRRTSNRSPQRYAGRRRTGRVSDAQVSEFIEDVGALPIRVLPAADSAQWSDILTLVQQRRLTAWDAAYLDLARRTGLPRRRSVPSDGRSRRSTRGI
jgi:hypothetical protein